MAKSDADRIAAPERSLEAVDRLERENTALKKRVHLLELYVDSERREREGRTLDRVRDAWRASGLCRSTAPRDPSPAPADIGSPKKTSS
jgi:hypothetical protein